MRIWRRSAFMRQCASKSHGVLPEFAANLVYRMLDLLLPVELAVEQARRIGGTAVGEVIDANADEPEQGAAIGFDR
jgi:hypothetical protein